MNVIYLNEKEGLKKIVVFVFILYQTTRLKPCSKLKAFAEDSLNVTQTMKFVLYRIENIVIKTEKS